ncbi:hypothetical protein BS17DRAFT_773144 [Gyrodon lividus]|nr:hypothetical protein BS17DRAFT_773144 [Gyrodon lividus]
MNNPRSWRWAKSPSHPFETEAISCVTVRGMFCKETHVRIEPDALGTSIYFLIFVVFSPALV